MSVHIAVDVGGTHIRAAVYSQESLEPQKLERTTTKDADSTPLERIKNLIASIWPEDETVQAIGIAAPGPLDPFKGVILSAPNIPGWKDLPISQELEDRFQVPVLLGNDADLAALGEWHFGAGKGHHHVVYMTISTGIGGGVIINDQLLRGRRGLAAELGHVTIMPDGPMCSCGQRGHLEAIASGTAIARWVQDELKQGAESSLRCDQEITAKLVSQAAKKGDQLAIDALARAGSFIGLAMANYLHIFNPTIVIIGGGVSRSGDLLLEPMRTAMKEHIMTPHYMDDFTLTTAALGDEAGLMGALALARSSSSE
jgi:glucokinase